MKSRVLGIDDKLSSLENILVSGYHAEHAEIRLSSGEYAMTPWKQLIISDIDAIPRHPNPDWEPKHFGG